MFSWEHKVYVYHQLKEIQPAPGGSDDVFCTALDHGEIVCSSLFPRGYILVLSIVPGEPISTMWHELSAAQKIHVRDQCRKAISILRQKGIYIWDTGKRNVLYERETDTVTLIDFESTAPLPPEGFSVEGPELYRIFGTEFGITH